jgi:hypothetical protein
VDAAKGELLARLVQAAVGEEHHSIVDLQRVLGAFVAIDPLPPAVVAVEGLHLGAVSALGDADDHLVTVVRSEGGGELAALEIDDGQAGRVGDDGSGRAAGSGKLDARADDGLARGQGSGPDQGTVVGEARGDAYVRDLDGEGVALPLGPQGPRALDFQA